MTVQVDMPVSSNVAAAHGPRRSQSTTSYKIEVFCVFNGEPLLLWPAEPAVHVISDVGHETFVRVTSSVLAPRGRDKSAPRLRA